MTAQLEGIGMTSRRTRMRLVQRLREGGIESDRVLEVIGQVPRHIFLDEALSHRAYEDTSLPIGHGQTLSQPYIVARMTELLLAHAPQRVLELGTGSGYQTAVLSQLFPEIYSVERIRPLQDRARDRLRQLNVRNVLLQTCGWWYGLARTRALRWHHRNGSPGGGSQRTAGSAGRWWRADSPGGGRESGVG